MSVEDIEVTFDSSMLDQYPQHDSFEGLIRAALANYDGDESTKESDSKYGTGKHFKRGYNS